jgi:hypothetical protein
MVNVTERPPAARARGARQFGGVGPLRVWPGIWVPNGAPKLANGSALSN